MRRFTGIILLIGAAAAGAVAANALGHHDRRFAGAIAEVRDSAFGHDRGSARHHRGDRLTGALLRQADANGDRALSQSEVNAFVRAKVAVGDDNDDSSLSLQEFETVWLDVMRRPIVDRFQGLDQDGDGLIEPQEFNERFGGVVARLDRNRDGVVDRADRRRWGGRHDRGEHRRDPRAAAFDDGAFASERAVPFPQADARSS